MVRKKKSQISISIESCADITSVETGRAFMAALCADPRLMPERVDDGEPVREHYAGIDDFAANWWAQPYKGYTDGVLTGEGYWGPIWKRRSALRSWGMVSHRLVRDNGDIDPGSISWECGWDKTVDYEGLFDSWFNLLSPSMAMLHLHTEQECFAVEDGSEYVPAFYTFGGRANPRITNIGWAMAYGPGYMNYRQDVDVARIRAAGFSVEEKGAVAIIRVTDKLSDVVDDFAHFSRRRAELKSLFRPDLFAIKHEPGSGDLLPGPKVLSAAEMRGETELP